MNQKEFENTLYKHSERTKAAIEPIIDINNIELSKQNKQNKRKPIRAFCFVAAVLSLAVTTAFAASHYLTARETAESLGDNKLAENIISKNEEPIWLTDGDYRAAVLGIASGAEISDFGSSADEIFPERTYVVTAIEKTDGSEMTYEDNILVTPLIEGLKPWQYNIFTMNGSFVAKIIDGVLYRIIEVDSIECFADRHLYLGVVSESFIDNLTYNFDEDTGLISVNEDFDGTNLLFDLDIDKLKADPEKAEEYLKENNFE